jgi:hypothetical protein
MMHESVPTKYDLIKSKDFYLYQMMHESVPTKYEGPGWLNELGRWILQLIQVYHQYGVGSCPAL